MVTIQYVTEMFHHFQDRNLDEYYNHSIMFALIVMFYRILAHLLIILTSTSTKLKGPIPSISVVTLHHKSKAYDAWNSFSLYNHMRFTLFWVKFGDAFAYFVV